MLRLLLLLPWLRLLAAGCRSGRWRPNERLLLGLRWLRLLMLHRMLRLRLLAAGCRSGCWRP